VSLEQEVEESSRSARKPCRCVRAMLRRMDAKKRREKQRWKDAVEMARRSHDMTCALWQQREKEKG
jgi:hypothetical protein